MPLGELHRYVAGGDSAAPAQRWILVVDHENAHAASEAPLQRRSVDTHSVPGAGRQRDLTPLVEFQACCYPEPAVPGQSLPKREPNL